MRLKFYALSFFSFCAILLIILNSSMLPQKKEAINSYYQEILNQCLENYRLIGNSSNLSNKQEAYLKSRSLFKKAEPILAYFEIETYEQLNQANIVGVEELEDGEFMMEKPFGFQITEEFLFLESGTKKEAEENYQKTLHLLKELVHITPPEINANQFLSIIRLQIIRIASLGITGFDSPTKSSLKESALSYQTLEKMIEYNKEEFKNDHLYNLWIAEIRESKNLLEKGEFDNFDRYQFIKDHTQKQLELVQETAMDWSIEFDKNSAISAAASSLFSAHTFNPDFFDQSAFSEEKSTLGKRLFNDPKLSLSGELSCASCHQEKFAFADSLLTFEGQKRNTPSLHYAALQNKYFYDMRSENLQNQIIEVVKNPKEFNTDLNQITQKILADSSYTSQFQQVYREKVNGEHIVDAISQYVKSLSPFNSKFDRNMNNKENTLSKAEKNGFNLFMGKAECGTCHFAPVFNGTVPPNFETTEMELIGVPQDNQNLAVSSDLGRFDASKVDNRKHFFKTPTVRNSSKTAPYMHNGSYNTLEEVVDFYNVGGGEGVGFNLPFQTLPSDSLNLSETEIRDLIAFLNSLEDPEKLN